jgi:RNA polymerase sigma-70 factor (ECF subfamily)
METDAFQELFRRVQAGDSGAAAELVRTYEPELRRYVRMRMTDPRLRRMLDSSDICQSVLGNFFLRATAGQIDLEGPAHLLKLLSVMVKHKVLDHVRKEQAGCRDHRRVEAAPAENAAVEDVTPSRIASGKELVAELRRRLGQQELYLYEQRNQEPPRPWEELADELGETAEALRKRYTRAIKRVAGELGLEDDHA